MNEYCRSKLEELLASAGFQEQIGEVNDDIAAPIVTIFGGYEKMSLRFHITNSDTLYSIVNIVNPGRNVSPSDGKLCVKIINDVLYERIFEDALMKIMDNDIFVSGGDIYLTGDTIYHMAALTINGEYPDWHSDWRP
jgi:hypothetical protein